MGSSAGPKLNAVLPTNNLLLSLDASNQSSYPRSGTTWTDISSNNYVGTLTNGPTFNSSNGGSISFDGSNDYVDVANTGTTFQFSNTTFSVNCWVTPSALAAGVVISKGASASIGGWLIQMNADGTFTVTTKFSNGNTCSTRTTALAAVANTPCNIVAVITTNTTTQGSNNILLYFNGVASQGSLTLSNVYSATSDTVQIGRRPTGNYFSGRISSVQIYNRALTAAEILDSYNGIKSKFVLYDSFADLTLLYVRGTGTIGDTTVPNLIRGGKNISLTAGTAIDDKQNKWGGVSIKMTNATLYLGPAITSIGTGDFTMELWIYATDRRSDIRFIGGGSTNQVGFGSRSPNIGMVIEGISWYVERPFTMLTNQWVHLAACRSSGTVRYFQNGTLIGSGGFTNSVSMNAPHITYVTSGAVGTGTWVNDVRITRAARYTAAFTVPTRQFDLPY